MKDGFRQSMAWLHTWTGLVMAWVLFFVFVPGARIVGICTMLMLMALITGVIFKAGAPAASR